METDIFIFFFFEKKSPEMSVPWGMPLGLFYSITKSIHLVLTFKTLMNNSCFMKTPFLKPADVLKKTEKVPVSARIDSQTRDYLESRAKQAKISLSNLVSHTLESYSKWLRQAEPFFEYIDPNLERIMISFETVENIIQHDFDNYMSFFDGSIFYSGEREEDELILVGKIHVRIWHLGSAIDNGEDLWPLFDHESSDTAAVYEAIIDQNNGIYKEGLLEGENFQHDLISIEGIEIVPEFRGHRIGHYSVLRTLQKLGRSCAAAIISPIPWVHGGDEEWKKRLELNSFNVSEAQAKRKLRKYWGQIGFEPTSNPIFMISDMERFPLISEIFGEEK